MKIRNLNVSLSKDDILGLCSYQDQITIKSLSIDNDIKLNASYKVIGVNLDFNITLSYDKLENNIIYINIKEFTLAKKNNINPLVKKSINFIINALSSIKGLYIDMQSIKINLAEIINSYLVEENYLKLNNLLISSLNFNNNSIEFLLNTLDFDILPNKK